MSRYPGRYKPDSQQRIAHALGEIDPDTYISNAVFKVSIDTLAKMLIPMVQGLAAHAKGQAEILDEAIRKMRNNDSIV